MLTNEKKAQLREKVAQEVRSLLIGPRNGDNEIVHDNLSYMYMTGILYAKQTKRSHISEVGSSSNADQLTTDDDLPDAAKDQLDEYSGDEENPLSMANEFLPSCVGMSFNVKKGSHFEIFVSAARYTKNKDEKRKAVFSRIPFKEEVIHSSNIKKDKLIFKAESRNFGKISILRRDAKFQPEYDLITVTLINEIRGDDNKKGDPQNNLYQVKMACKLPDGSFGPFGNSNSRSSSDLEESILNLQYRTKTSYATGHGCSVGWSKEGENNNVRKVFIDYMPREFIHRPIFDQLPNQTETLKSHIDRAFSIAGLASKEAEHDADEKRKIIKSLKAINQSYKDWIEIEKQTCEDLSNKTEYKYLYKELKRSSDRIDAGIDYLSKDDGCWVAFVHANRAMLLQMMQMNNIREERSKREKSNLKWPIPINESIKPDNNEFPKNSDVQSPRWRPFQLAFFLMSFLGLEENQEHERGFADLIWFATGGGKTEAYLLLSSYEMLRRRTRWQTKKMGFGTAIITRYTLRFLTSDQFSRTASLMCALEKVRINNVEIYGDEPFSAGLYVGGELSYNNYAGDKGAKAAWNDIKSMQGDKIANHKFNINECPNCGTEIIPFLEKDRAGGRNIGIKFENGAFVFRCLNTECLFGDEDNCIPIKTTDECIYKNPPSFILGTIDKFAMVAMRTGARKLFGYNGQKSTAPPSLIIQDEMHLISGPLGTIAAIYEAAFDQLIKKRQAEIGISPFGAKYVASSATVRDSATQLLRLTARQSLIFPARGFNANDSFFSANDGNDDMGRLYIGVMSQGISKQAATDWLNAAIIQSVRYVSEQIESKEELDFLWTLIAYCNSKKELGLISLSLQQQVIQRIKVYARAQKYELRDNSSLEKFEISADTIKDISIARNKLLTPVSNKLEKSESKVVDFVPCTNMISVGIDIDRLGLMVINGQPKTTAEYIQASSRVGRDPVKKGPGLVFTLYAPARPRDRSHFEQFKTYHQSIYRGVEPTSVTPGSMPALKRALHASIIILLRHGFKEFRENQDASKFHNLINTKDIGIGNALDRLKKRIKNCYQDMNQQTFDYERGQIDARFNEVVSDWKKWSQNNYNLVFSARWGDQDTPSLMYGAQHKDQKVGFPTMYSMRSVDVEVSLDVR